MLLLNNGGVKMAGLNKDDVDLHFNTNQFNEDDHAKQISFFYKALYQINDIVLGIIFLIGSFLFFSDQTMICRHNTICDWKYSNDSTTCNLFCP